MAAGRGVAAPPAGPRWTAHPPESRGLSWLCCSLTKQSSLKTNTQISYKILLHLDRWV